MAHIKYISPSGWDFDRPIAVPLKWPESGLVGNDRKEFIKIAGHAFQGEIDRIKIAKDEVPIHLIALGASEFYGPNRNGDGFRAATCRACYPTFIKFARYYNNHRNKPEQGHPHYGVIKAAAWNEPMQRVELIVALNAAKSACQRNGGEIDEKALEKLGKGEDIGVSMACRVSYDVCSWCGNKAKSRSEYCTREKCAAGGCKENLARLVKVAGDIHHLHVDNPNPVWFDISRVFRPADRIAWGTKADWLTKTAGVQYDTVPLEVVLYQDGIWNDKTTVQVKLAHALAQCEQAYNEDEACLAFSPEVQQPFAIESLGKPGTTKCAEALTALAEEKIILSLRDFARLVGKSMLVKKALARLPGVYGRMIKDGSLARRIEQNKFPMLNNCGSLRQRTFATSCTQQYSLEKEAVCHRSMLAAIRGVQLSNSKDIFEKFDPQAEELARDYAIYKLAALEKIAAFDKNFPLTVRYALSQNYLLNRDIH